MRGPYQESVNLSDRNTYRIWYRSDLKQKKRTPLPYRNQTVTRKYYEYNGSISADTASALTYYYSGDTESSKQEQLAYNRAYAKFVEGYSEACQVLVDSTEMRGNLQLLGSLISGLRSPLKTFARQASRSARRNKNVGQTMTRPLGAMGKGWLTWNFAIKPTLQEIHELMVIITSTTPEPLNVRARAGLPASRVWKNKSGAGDIFDGIEDMKSSVQISARLSVTNPNLLLANQVGLLNPASFLWETIPWSWALDYVLNVGQMASALTDFAGVSVIDPYTTYYSRGKALLINPRAAGVVRRGTVVVEWVRLRRVLGFSAPRLVFNYKPLSLTRAANLLSVLVVALNKQLSQ